MALLFTYRSSSLAAAHSAAPGLVAERESLSSFSDGGVSGPSGGGVDLPQPSAEPQEAWSVPLGGFAQEVGADVREFPFSCLDLLTAFEGEV